MIKEYFFFIPVAKIQKINFVYKLTQFFAAFYKTSPTLTSNVNVFITVLLIYNNNTTNVFMIASMKPNTV